MTTTHDNEQTIDGLLDVARNVQRCWDDGLTDTAKIIDNLIDLDLGPTSYVARIIRFGLTFDDTLEGHLELVAAADMARAWAADGVHRSDCDHPSWHTERCGCEERADIALSDELLALRSAIWTTTVAYADRVQADRALQAVRS